MKKRYAPKGSLIAALDIGTSKITCFIARIIDDQGGFDVLGVGHHQSEGVKAGVITDLDLAERVIRKTVHAAESMAAEATKGYPLREVIVNLPATHALSYGRTVDVQIAGHEVTEKDIRSALVTAQNEIAQDGYSFVHTIPVGFRIDQSDGIQAPQGMVGQVMSADVHAIIGEDTIMKNIAGCTDRSHLDIAAFCSSAYAAGLATLVEDEMDLGCTIIDIGGGVTSIAVFHGGSIIYSDAIPVGGHHVTNDIATGLTTSLADAERLKILYGHAITTGLDEAELIDVPRLGEEDRREPNHIPRSLLVGIIQPRLEEVFELVRAKLNDSGLGSALGRRVVLTGGASQMSGIKDLASHVLDKQIRSARPIRASGLPDAVNGPAFSVVSGMLSYAAQHGHEVSAGLHGHVSTDTIMQAVKKWLKENW